MICRNGLDVSYGLWLWVILCRNVLGQDPAELQLCALWFVLITTIFRGSTAMWEWLMYKKKNNTSHFIGIFFVSKTYLFLLIIIIHMAHSSLFIQTWIGKLFFHFTVTLSWFHFLAVIIGQSFYKSQEAGAYCLHRWASRWTGPFQ